MKFHRNLPALVAKLHRSVRTAADAYGTIRRQFPIVCSATLSWRHAMKRPRLKFLQVAGATAVAPPAQVPAFTRKLSGFWLTNKSVGFTSWIDELS